MKKFFLLIFLIGQLSVYPESLKVHPNINYRLKLYSLCTPSHEILKDNYFLPSIKDDFEIIIKHFDQKCKSAKFMSSGWNSIMINKVDVILAAIKENWNKIFIYSDVDIQFFKSFKNKISDLIQDKDIVIQKADPSCSLCAGFFICRGNAKTFKLWNEIKHRMLKNSKLDDQIPLNQLLLNGNYFNLRWGLLPDEFFNGGLYTGKIWKPGIEIQVPKNIIIHHACFTIGTEHKIKQLEYVKSKLKIANQKMAFHEYFLDLFKHDQVKTEYTAYQLFKNDPVQKNINYLVVPWSVLINSNKLNLIPDIKAKGGFTICQHVHYEKIIPILKKIGINVLFTPHVNKVHRDIKVLPFAHLAMNAKIDNSNKDIYYSFIGFNTHSSRAKLFKMKHPKNSLIVERKQWHFDQASADNQLKEKIEYENVLSRSRFSLCPRGFGASTLRFWESLKVGAIPILIADDMILPAGYDWSKCIVRIKEKDILKINDVLARICKVKENQMRKNCLEAYSLFSENNFVKVIRDYYKNNY